MLLPTVPNAARPRGAAASRRQRAPTRIDAVRVDGRGREATIHVRVTHPCRVVRTQLRAPERVVLDFSPAKWGGSRPRPAKCGPVRAVRIAQHPGGRVRLVVDTEPHPSRWKGRFRGAEWLGQGQVDEPETDKRRPVGGEERARRRSLRGMVIGIDPGHGGSDPGAMAACGLEEKEVTLRIARQLRRLLKRQGARVRMTRVDDRRLPKESRIAFVARGGLDLMISLHCDASDGAPHCTGITTYYHDRSRRSRELAEALQGELPGATGMSNRGARSDVCLYDSGLYVLRNAACPAVLIETGYISCAPTAARLRDPGFRQQVARGIVEGVRRYVTDAPVRTARR